jgi:hypothetical protein
MLKDKNAELDSTKERLNQLMIQMRTEKEKDL